jgi:hypothetical protein
LEEVMLSRLLSAVALVLSLSYNAAAEAMFTILPATAVDQLLNQCSRSAPDKGEATWLPSEREIARIEAVLPGALRAAGHAEAADAIATTRKQYVGIARGGKRFLYANILGGISVEGIDWTRTPIVICDGGPTLFGVEIDIETMQITHFATNGSV